MWVARDLVGQQRRASASIDCPVHGMTQPLPRDDNWRGDVNEDGRINVLDLIYARNLIGTTRP